VAPGPTACPCSPTHSIAGVASYQEALNRAASSWTICVEITATVAEAVAAALANEKALLTEGSSVVVTTIAGARFVSRRDARIVERIRTAA
jgi:hypothetical protein